MSEICNSVVVDGSGNVFVAGGNGSVGSQDYMLIKYSPAGAILWTKILNRGTNPENWTDMTLHNNGGVVVCGYTAGDMRLARYDADGTLAWEKTQDGGDGLTNTNDIPYTITADSIGYIYVAGQSNNANTSRIVVSKYSVGGIKQWAILLGSAALDVETPIDIAADVNGAAVCGYLNGGGEDFWVAGLGLNGSVAWSRTMSGGAEDENATGIALLPNLGDVIVTGNIYVTQPNNFRSSDFATFRLKRNTGETEWSAFYHAGSTDNAKDVGVDGAGNVYVSGSSAKTSDGDGIATVKYDSAGAEQWVKRYDDNDANTFFYPEAMYVDPAGGVNVIAMTYLSSTPTVRRTQLQAITPDGVVANTAYDEFPGTESPADIAGNQTGYVAFIVNGENAAANYDWQTTMLRQVPIAKPDAYDVDEDVSKGVSAPGFRLNDFYTIGATAVKFLNPTKGNLVFNSNGSFVYTPNQDVTGTDSFTYLLQRGGVFSATVAVTLTIKPAPTAVQDSYSTPVDTPLQVPAPGVLANDQNVENGIAKLWTNPTSGMVTLNDDGSFEYTPNAGFNGLDFFTYKAERNQSLSNNEVKCYIYVGTATVAAFSMTPSTVVGGNNTTGKITLSTVAPLGGAVCNVTDNSSAITSPPTATVGQGNTIVFFPIPTTPVAVTVTRTVTVERGGVSKTASLTISAPSILSLVLNPTTVVGGQDLQGTATLTGKAPAGGASVAITDNTSAINTPSNAVVLAGNTSVNFPITTTFVGADSVRTVTATYANTSKTANLTIKTGYAVVGLSMNPSTVKGGNPSTGTVTLNKAAPAGGLVVNLSDTTSAINTPATVTIPAGSVTGTFGVTTTAVSQSYVRKITASHNNTTKTTDLVLTP